MNLISIPAFQDNYIWLLADSQKQCVIVDPGESAPVLAALSQDQYLPQAILLTHHHNDHVGGVADLCRHFPNIPVYGPQETADKGATEIVKGGDSLTINGRNHTIIAVPGHTLGHIAYYSKPYLSVVTRFFPPVAAGYLKARQSKCMPLFNSSRNFLMTP